MNITQMAPSSECRGWGSWRTPFVMANSSAQAVQFLSGKITIPPMSVAVHPGPDRDMSVAWSSPIEGKVAVRAQLAHAHPSGGDGVSWMIVHSGLGSV